MIPAPGQKGAQDQGTRRCRECHRSFPARSAQQAFCSHDHWKAWQYAHAAPAHKHFEKSPLKPHLAAPALATSCAQLEAQLVDLDRHASMRAIAAFTTPNVPGYRDLAQLTRACVAAKWKLAPASF